jgi:hypothetical protein
MATNSKNSNISAYEQNYIPYIIRWGRFTNLIGVVLSIIPGLVLLFIFGLKPPISAVITGFVMQASVSGVFWFVEPISYFPVLGIPGTYMSFLSGNIGNLRLPVAVAAQEAASVEPGTEQGSVISTIGVGVSIVVNIAILTIGVLLGASVLSLIPKSILATLSNILPALFGAMFGQQLIANPKIGAVAAVLAGGMIGLSKLGILAYLPFGGTYVIIIVAVFGSILIGKKINKNEEKEKSISQ